MIIGKEFYFESAHKLPDAQIYGACRFLHGHSYKLRVEVEGEINKYGWVMNFKDLKDIVKRNVLDLFDHNNINDFLQVPTAENMLEYIKPLIERELPEGVKLHSITLWETESSYAKYKI